MDQATAHSRTPRFYIQGRTPGHAWRTVATSSNRIQAHADARRHADALTYGAMRQWRDVRVVDDAGRTLAQYRLGRLLTEVA